MMLFTQVLRWSHFLQCRLFLAVDQNVLDHSSMPLNGGTYKWCVMSVYRFICARLCSVCLSYAGTILIRYPYYIYSVRSGQIRNSSSARISMPGQVMR